MDEDDDEDEAPQANHPPHSRRRLMDHSEEEDSEEEEDNNDNSDFAANVNETVLNVLQQSRHIARVSTMTSAASKERSALNHFNYFLKTQCPQFAGKTAKDLVYEDLVDKIFGEFANYMASNATHGCKPNAAKLSLNTATGYFSSVKMFFVKKFPDKDMPQCFQKSKWNIYTSGISRVIVDRCKQDKTPLVNPHEAASEEDCCHVGVLCTWHGSLEMIEFWHFCNGMAHLAARGNEVAHATHEQMSMHILNEDQETNEVLKVHVNNWKTASAQDMFIFPHFSKWQLDYYFSLAMLIAVEDAESESVFPTFSKKASEKTATGKRKANGVSHHWNECLKKMLGFFLDVMDSLLNDEDIDFETQKKKHMHGWKKYSIQRMSAILDPLPIIFRAGWDLQNAHSFFDYVVR